MNMKEYKEYMRKVTEGVIETGTNACKFESQWRSGF